MLLPLQRGRHVRARRNRHLLAHEISFDTAKDGRPAAELQNVWRGGSLEADGSYNNRIVTGVVAEQDQAPQTALMRVRRIARSARSLPRADAGARGSANERASLGEHLAFGTIDGPNDLRPVEEHALDAHVDHGCSSSTP